MENEYILVDRISSALYKITSISNVNNPQAVAIGKTWVTVALIESYGMHPVSSELVNLIRQEWDVSVSIKLISGSVVFGNDFERLSARYT